MQKAWWFEGGAVLRDLAPELLAACLGWVLVVLGMRITDWHRVSITRFLPIAVAVTAVTIEAVPISPCGCKR